MQAGGRRFDPVILHQRLLRSVVLKGMFEKAKQKRFLKSGHGCLKEAVGSYENPRSGLNFFLENVSFLFFIDL